MAKKKSEVDSTSGNADPKKTDERVTYWLNEIDAAKQREKDFRKDGDRIIEIYDGRKSDVTPFNILYSNTETIAPTLYSMTPRPVVQRRFKDDDPMGMAAAKAGQRMLEFLLDTNIDGYETYSEAMNASVLSAVLPGRGVTSIKYDYEEGQLAPAATAEPAEEGAQPPPPDPYKKTELVCPESREWNRVYFGYARKWSKVPWVAYEEHIDKEEAIRLCGKEVANQIEFTVDEDSDEEGARERTDDERNKGERKTALVYKIWDKRGGKKVRFVSPQMRSGFLKVLDDPLGLTGFFDCPRPLTFVQKVNDLIPVALYILYENQAKELNRITLRLNRMVEACKARGAYDGTLGALLEKIMDEDDNALVPTEDGTLVSDKGLAASIWFMPLAEIIATLEKLYQAREACKTVIYEIIGIADIMRGASKASETLGAQEIKNQWGTLRIKPKQAEVQRYARDLLRMMLEVAASKFSEETWAKMTGLPFSTTQQLQQAQMLMQAAQQQMAMMPPPQPGQPPPQPPPALQQAQAVLAAPKWPDILKMLQDDLQRAYRIDIETNSTIEPEAAEDQKHIAELMAQLGQFLNGIGGLVEKGVMPFEVAQSMMLAISRRHRFGQDIEEQIKAMKAPPPQDDGEAQKAQQQMQQMQQQLAEATQAKQAAEQKLASTQDQIKMLEKGIALDQRERDLETREALFEIEKKAAQESLQVRDKAGQESLQNKEKVAHISDAVAKREQSQAQAANKKIDVGAQALAKSSMDMKQVLDKMLQIVEAQGQQTQEMVKALISAVTAPRTRTAERGPDGRISMVREQVENGQERA